MHDHLVKRTRYIAIIFSFPVVDFFRLLGICPDVFGFLLSEALPKGI